MSLSQHPRLSLLGLPSEIRRSVLLHLFSDSWVTYGSMCAENNNDIHQNLEVGIVLTCKKLSREAQPLLISSTQLLVGAGGYVPNLPRAVFQSYMFRIEHLTLSVGSVSIKCNVDLRFMPYLKTLVLFNYPERKHTQPTKILMDPQWTALISAADNRILLGAWKSWLATKRRFAGYAPSSPSLWLLKLLDDPFDTPIEMIMHFTMHRGFYVSENAFSDTDDWWAGAKYKVMIGEIYLDILTEKVLQRKVVQDDYRGPSGDSSIRDFLDSSCDGATVYSDPGAPY